LKLEDGGKIHLSNILYVPGLKKNLLAISCLEDKGYIISFVDGKVLVCGKDYSIEKARAIRIWEERLYGLLTLSPQDLVHMYISPYDIWNRSYGNLHYKILSSLSKMIKVIPNLKEDHEGVCKGCALGKKTRKRFSSSDSRSK